MTDEFKDQYVELTQEQGPDVQERLEAMIDDIDTDYDHGMNDLGALNETQDFATEDEAIIAHALEILPHLGAEVTAGYLISATGVVGRHAGE